MAIPVRYQQPKIEGRLDHSAALVVGGGMGVDGWSNGAAAALLYAMEGARVMVGDVDIERATMTSDAITSCGGQAEPFAVEVTRPEDVNRVVEACVEGFGQLDVLHNNVGMVTSGAISDIDLKTWNRTQSVNVAGIYLTCRAALPHLEAGDGGAIVNIGSIAGMRGIGTPVIAYSVSKAAVAQLTRGIALEYATRGVRANTVSPGLIDSPLVGRALLGSYGSASIEGLRAARAARCPSGRMGTVWDVAEAAIFLASPQASYITGHELVVDGGLSVRAA